MRSNLCKHVAAVAAVIVTVSNAAAGGGSFVRGCAARDMQVLMMIEQSEASRSASAQKLSEAMQTVLHARMVCHEGYVADALALYDDIARSLTSDWALTGHNRIR